MYDEDDFLRALAAMSNRNFNEKDWLIDNFDLYKKTLIWPPGLPPIKTCGLIEGTSREKFHSTYRFMLSAFDYEFDNNKRTLKFIRIFKA